MKYIPKLTPKTIYCSLAFLSLYTCKFPVALFFILQDLNSTLKKHCPDGVDVVYESVGGEVYNTCVNRLAIKGRLIVIGYISGYQSPMGVGSMKSARWHAANILSVL